MSDYDNEIFDYSNERIKGKGMDTLTQEQEDQITNLMAKTFYFGAMGNGGENDSYKCKICNKRLMRHYAGMPINERMIQHWQINHSANYPARGEEER